MKTSPFPFGAEEISTAPPLPDWIDTVPPEDIELCPAFKLRLPPTCPEPASTDIEPATDAFDDDDADPADNRTSPAFDADFVPSVISPVEIVIDPEATDSFDVADPLTADVKT